MAGGTELPGLDSIDSGNALVCSKRATCLARVSATICCILALARVDSAFDASCITVLHLWVSASSKRSTALCWASASFETASSNSNWQPCLLGGGSSNRVQGWGRDRFESPKVLKGLKFNSLER
jgi:hypothetical protein